MKNSHILGNFFFCFDERHKKARRERDTADK